MKEVDGEEPLHYVNVDSAKLQKITGLDSETAEYAEIQSIEGDGEEEETVADTQLGQEKTP
ncbi:hypothetical protein F7725_018178 [Dissostichus mawsoni]|nr:hypothetical protein F7725_018178 [Dissostichus mawsoni]